MTRKLLALLMGGVIASSAADAQTRTILYEEFSGENCGPCAAYNPGLMAILDAGVNTNDVILLKYQSPIPSAGPIYNQYTTATDARLTYYSVPFAPYGRMDGKQVGDGNIANFTQGDLNTEKAVSTPFNISVTHSFSADGDSVFATVTVSTTGAFAPSGANMKLRAALVEDLSFDAAPGTNGEKEFHNVMRRMYPDAAGTTVPNSWASGDSYTYTLSGPVPSYVDKTSGVMMVVWLQNDNDKLIAQAAKSNEALLQVEVASEAITASTSSLICASTSPTPLNPTVTLKNAGSNALTSAKIFYMTFGAGSWSTYDWTGNLASGATTTVSLPTISVPFGTAYIIDSVALPNGMEDVNKANNEDYAVVNVYDQNGVAMPVTTGFENSGENPTGWLTYDANDNGNNVFVASQTGSNIGHNGSTYTLYHNNYDFADGETNYAIFQAATIPAGAKAIDFWVAHAPYNTTYLDKLEIVYSTNCGSSWTTVWSANSTALATAPATTSPFVPTASQWAFKSIDATVIPAGSMVAFRFISGYSNNMFVDDVTFRAGSATGVENTVISNADVTVSPNPARDVATISLTLNKATDVNILVIDAVGRTVQTINGGQAGVGAHTYSVATAGLAAGLYTVKVQTTAGFMTKTMSVVK